MLKTFNTKFKSKSGEKGFFENKNVYHTKYMLTSVSRVSRKDRLQAKSGFKKQLNGIDCKSFRTLLWRGLNYFYCLFISSVWLMFLKCTNFEFAKNVVYV